MHQTHKVFVEWASGYDRTDFSGRNRARHEAWLARQSTPVLRLDGVKPPGDLAAEVISALAQYR